MQRPLFSRPDWNRGWLYDTGLAVGTLNSILVGGGVDDWLTASGVSPAIGGVAGLVSMALCVVVAVALFRIPDTHVPERLPALGAVPPQFRLFKIPAAVVLPWFGAFVLVTPVGNAVSLPVGLVGLFAVANLVAVLACYLLVSRQHSRQQSGPVRSV